MTLFQERAEHDVVCDERIDLHRGDEWAAGNERSRNVDAAARADHESLRLRGEPVGHLRPGASEESLHGCAGRAVRLYRADPAAGATVNLEPIRLAAVGRLHRHA